MADLLTRIAARAGGKAFSDLHPELDERVHILRVWSDQAAQETPLSFAASAADYQRSAWVHRAVKVLADNIAPLRVRVVVGEGNDLEPLPEHPVSLLLAFPNKVTSAAALWRQWTTDMMLAGEEGQEVVYGAGGQPSELWPRQPSVFTVKPGPGGLRYFNVAGYQIEDQQGSPYNLKPEEFIHYKFYNPANQWRGLAPISAIRMAISIDQLAQAWSRLFFKNSARPDYAIVAPEGTTQSEKDDILAKLRERHSGDRAHEPLVLEQGLADVKPLSFPPKDMEWVNQRELSREEIGAVFGVPDEIMGFGKDTYENFGQALRVMVMLTLTPLAGMRDDALTSFFRGIKLLGADERIETDMRSLTDALEDRNQSWTMAQGQITSGALTINEYRQTNGMPDVAWGDTWWAPMSQIPVSDSQIEPEPTSQRAAKAAAPQYGTAAHEALWKGRQARISIPVKKMQRMLKRSFQAQQVDVSRRLRNSRHFGRARYKDSVPPVQTLFDAEEWTRVFEEQYGPVVAETMATVGAAELEALGFDEALDLTRPEVQAAYKRVLGAFAKKVNDTTYDELVGLFQDAEAAGEGIPAIMERLSVYFEGRKSDYQTERIARTTMTSASNSASVEAWEQSEVVAGKTWISALLPDRTRDAHFEAHGQTVGLNELFIVGGEEMDFPGDPAGSPENVINCLCTTTAALEDEMGLRAYTKRAPRRRAPEEDMQIHTHVHLPDSLKLEIPATTVINQMPEQPAPKVEVTVAPAEATRVEVRNEVPAAAAPVIENKVEVRLPEPADDGETEETITIEARDGAGRPSKVKKTRRAKRRGGKE